jgi:hypothetical protein
MPKAKTKRKILRRPVPRTKWCVRCKKHRVKYHHYYCEKCWREVHGITQKNNQIIPFDNGMATNGGKAENGKIHESITDELNRGM